MEKHQLNVRLTSSRKTLLKRLSAKSGLKMTAVIEYALTLVDEREIVNYANQLRDSEAQSYAA